MYAKKNFSKKKFFGIFKFWMDFKLRMDFDLWMDFKFYGRIITILGYGYQLLMGYGEAYDMDYWYNDWYLDYLS